MFQGNSVRERKSFFTNDAEITEYPYAKNKTLHSPTYKNELDVDYRTKHSFNKSYCKISRINHKRKA